MALPRRASWIATTLAGMLTAGCFPAYAWTAPTEELVAREALRLMPASLRAVILPHLDEMEAGLRDAAASPGQAGHEQVPGQKEDGAASRVADLVRKIPAMVDDHQPFAKVAYEMGSLAHYVCDLNNPLNVTSDGDRKARIADDYAAYVESNLDRFKLVFYGWDDPDLARGDVAAAARLIAARARRYYPHISKAYAADNPAPLAQRFDVRSLPFGIGSLSYSRSVSDTARFWLHIWKQAHGDLTGTPYLARTAQRF